MICRTCLKSCTKSYKLYDMIGYYRRDGDTTKFSEVLKYIAPEMYLGVSKKPDICSSCVESLVNAYIFRKTCLQTEQAINKYLQQARCTAESIDLLDVMALDSSKENKKEPANTNPKCTEVAETPKNQIQVKFHPKVQPETNIAPKVDKLCHIDSVFSLTEKTYGKSKNTTTTTTTAAAITMPVKIKQEKLSPVPEKQKPNSFLEIQRPALVPQKTPLKKPVTVKVENATSSDEITIKEEVLDPETDPLAGPYDASNLQGIIDSIDRSCDNDEYDIPEFVQINKIELKQMQSTENYQSKIVPLKIVTSMAGTMQNSNLSLTGQNQLPRNILLQSFGKGLPPLVPLATTSLQNESGFYIAANVPSKGIIPSVAGNQATLSPAPLTTVANPKPVLKTIKSTVSISGDGRVGRSFAASTQGVQTVVKRRRGRVKIVPVAEVGATKAEPDMVCPPYSTYSPDGSYINDHDYLVTPYRKSKVSGSRQDKQMECFICGNKHAESRHATHMKRHGSVCDVCNEDLVTPFMLNLHYKTHAKPCKLCTEKVPYRDIEKHELQHLEEDKKFVESDVEKTQFGCHRGRKRQTDDERPVYFPVKLTDSDPGLGPKVGGQVDDGLIVRRRGRKKLSEEPSSFPVRKSPRISKTVKNEESSDAGQSDDGTVS